MELGNTINFGSFGTTATIDCANGRLFAVTGSNNTLTVSGTCAEVHVIGSDNRIALNQVDTLIDVAGSRNKITFKVGDPRIQKSGDDTDIIKV